MDDDVNRTHCLQYKYTFPHPLSSAEMSQIVGAIASSDLDCSSPSYPVVTWQTGVIRLHGPITVGLQYAKEGEFARQFIDIIMIISIIVIIIIFVCILVQCMGKFA